MTTLENKVSEAWAVAEKHRQRLGFAPYILPNKKNTHFEIVNSNNPRRGYEEAVLTDWLTSPEHYVAVLPGHDVSFLDGAMLFGEVDFPKDVPILTVNLLDIKNSASAIYFNSTPAPELADIVWEIVDMSNVVFDVRKDERYILEDTATSGNIYSWNRYKVKFVGQYPVAPHVVNIRESFISAISEYWAGSFISGYHERRTTRGNNLSFERASNLIQALSLGAIAFDIKSLKKYKAPMWQRDACKVVTFTDNRLPSPIEDIDQSAFKAQCAMKFWERAADDYRFSLRLDRDDLDDVERLSRLTKSVAEMIGVDSSFEAYAAGVFAEDLLI